MLESLIPTLSKSALTLFSKLVFWAIKPFERPSIKLKKAPSNLFSYIKPGITFDRLKEILGAPHKAYADQYLYSFKDICLQVEVQEDQLIKSVSVALTQVSRFSRFKIPPLDFILGKSNFFDVLGAESQIESDSSSKFYHYWTDAYYGSWGGGFYYTFGVLEAPNIASPENNKWSPNLQSRAEIPRNLKINWVSISVSEGLPPFSYLGFM